MIENLKAMQTVMDAYQVKIYTEKEGRLIKLGKSFTQTSDIAEMIWERIKGQSNSFNSLESVKNFIADRVDLLIRGQRSLLQHFTEEATGNSNDKNFNLFADNHIMSRDVTFILFWELLNTMRVDEHCWKNAVSEIMNKYLAAFGYIDSTVEELYVDYIDKMYYVNKPTVKEEPVVTKEEQAVTEEEPVVVEEEQAIAVTEPIVTQEVAQEAEQVEPFPEPEVEQKTTEDIVNEFFAIPNTVSEEYISKKEPSINEDDIPSQKEMFEEIAGGKFHNDGDPWSLIDLADYIEAQLKIEFPGKCTRYFKISNRSLILYMESIKWVKQTGKGKRYPTTDSINNGYLYYKNYQTPDGYTSPFDRYPHLSSKQIYVYEKGALILYRLIHDLVKHNKFQEFFLKPSKKSNDKFKDQKNDAHASGTVKEETTNASTLQKVPSENIQGYDRAESYNRNDQQSGFQQQDSTCVPLFGTEGNGQNNNGENIGKGSVLPNGSATTFSLFDV